MKRKEPDDRKEVDDRGEAPKRYKDSGTRKDAPSGYSLWSISTSEAAHNFSAKIGGVDLKILSNDGAVLWYSADRLRLSTIKSTCFQRRPARNED